MSNKYLKAKIKEFKQEKEREQMLLERKFLHDNIPSFHRLLMELFPWTRRLFDYGLAHEEGDKTKLTLIRGKKLITRNFDR